MGTIFFESTASTLVTPRHRPSLAKSVGRALAGLLALHQLGSPLQAIELISSVSDPALLGTTGSGPSDDLTRAALSADGRFVAFAGRATNLVPGEENAFADVYVRDLQTGTTRRASQGLGGADSDGDSFGPALSGDGRYVVFASSATNLVPGDTNGRTDVFRQDLQTGTMVRVSTGNSGAQGYGDSHQPAVSADGRFVAFTSAATELIGIEPSGFTDVLVKDLLTGSIVSASARAGVGPYDYASDTPSLSADGRFVAFASSLTGLGTPPVVNPSPLILVRDLETGTVTIANASGAGEGANGPSQSPSISADGGFVSFASTATNLAAGCVAADSGNDGIFLKDLLTGAVRCASANPAGEPANALCQRPSSPDGRHVLFQSGATNLVSGGTPARSLFVKNLDTGAVVLATDAGGGARILGGATGSALSADARFVAFVSDRADLTAGDTNGVADVFVKELETSAVALASPRDPAATTAPAAGGRSYSSRSSASRDGRFVVFGSQAANIVAGDTNGVADIFVRDRASGTTVRASTAADGTQADAASGESAISADGRFVAFTSYAANLVAGVNDKRQLFVKDLSSGAISLESSTAAGEPANDSIWSPSLSGDGRYVAFHSLASNLVAGDTNAFTDVFVRDRLTGGIARASTDGGGGQANHQSVYPAISADGGRVAFKSLASNLVGGDANGFADVFVKDLPTGSVFLASTSGSGAQANQSSDAPALSGDGRYAAFQSTATNLALYDPYTHSDVFVKDLQTGAIQMASTTRTGERGIAGSFAPSLSEDGRYVAFESGASNLSDTKDYASTDIFLKDLQTRDIDRFSAPPGVEQYEHARAAALSGDGRHIAFISEAENLVSADGNLAEDVFIAAVEADLRLTASGTATARAGGLAVFWFNVRNLGPWVAQQTAVSVAVPEGTTFDHASVDSGGWTFTAPPAGGGTVVFSRTSALLAGYNPGFALVVRIPPDTPEGAAISCSAHAQSTVADPTPGNLASWTTTVEARADLGVVLTGPAGVPAGALLEYVATLSNVGPSDARDVSLETSLPPGAAFVDVAQTSGPLFVSAGSGDRAVSTVATLPAGASASFTVTARADAGLPEDATLTATATASSPTTDANPADNVSTAMTAVTASADLEVQLDAPATVVAGEQFALRLTLTNRGPHDARNAAFSATLAPGIPWPTGSQTSGPPFSLVESIQGVSGSIPLLPAGASASFALGGTVSANVPFGTVLVSSAAVSSATPDPDPGDNAAAAETLVRDRADVSVSLEAPGTYPGCGGLTYTLTVVNRGPSGARQVSLTHAAPDGVAVASRAQLSGPPFDLAESARGFTAAIADLPAGAAATFILGVTGDGSLPEGTVLVGTATVSTQTPEAPAGSNQHLASAATAVAVANEAPLASAGGGYLLLAGGGLALDGSGSSDPDAGCGDAIVAWEWDVNGDGSYGEIAGPAAVLAWEQVQSLVCGGACAGGRSYPLGLRVTDARGAQGTASAALEIVLPVFTDDFGDGTAAGDPQWIVRSGRWGVTLGRFLAREGFVGRAFARLPEKTAAAGIVETGVLLPARRYLARPNGAVIFAWQDNSRYRYVTLSEKSIGIGQAGTFGQQRGGVRTLARRTSKGAWHPLRVEIRPDGAVDVFVDGEPGPALSHRFRTAVPGRIGLGADRSRTAFEDFTLWPPAALP